MKQVLMAGLMLAASSVTLSLRDFPPIAFRNVQNNHSYDSILSFNKKAPPKNTFCERWFTPVKKCKYHIVLVCAICGIKRNQVTKIFVVVSTCSIILECIDQISLLIHNKNHRKCRIYLVLSLSCATNN
jgi:hypothetical protein